MNGTFLEWMGAPRDAQVWIDGWAEVAAHTATGPIGARLVAISDEEVVLELPITDASRQPLGLLHGGTSLLLAETASSMHAAWLLAPGAALAPVGVDLNGTHISSATDGLVRVIARPIRRARAFVFHDVEVFHVPTDRLLCKARVTNYYRPIG